MFRSPSPVRGSPSILVIRRDNIGDLVLTTPMFEGLRRHFPGAYLAALVNSYNAAVLDRNPHLDEVFVYTKRKHLAGGSVFKSTVQRLTLLWKLRRRRFDYVILARNGFARRALGTARWLAPLHIAGFVEPPDAAPAAIDMPVDHAGGETLHAVEDLWRLLQPLGVAGAPPRTTLVPDPDLVEKLHGILPPQVPGSGGPLVALHISARKTAQRWPADNFTALARRLHDRSGARFLLLWSPGDESNPHHPGDDQKARRILAGIEQLPVAAVPTARLDELIAALSLSDAGVLSDGGAMHIAAALGKPVVCFFGNSSATRWRPWGVDHELLQKESRDVADITVEDAVAAWDRLSARTNP